MGLTATEPQSGEVVDNPRRWSAALAERLSRGYRRPKKWGELRSCDVVWTTFLPPLIPLQSHFHPTPNRVKTTSRAPRLRHLGGCGVYPWLPCCAAVGRGYPRHRHSVAPRLSPICYTLPYATGTPSAEQLTATETRGAA